VDQRNASGCWDGQTQTGPVGPGVGLLDFGWWWSETGWRATGAALGPGKGVERHVLALISFRCLVLYSCPMCDGAGGGRHGGRFPAPHFGSRTAGQKTEETCVYARLPTPVVTSKKISNARPRLGDGWVSMCLHKNVSTKYLFSEIE
jgi:hypothetical protein